MGSITSTENEPHTHIKETKVSNMENQICFSTDMKYPPRDPIYFPGPFQGEKFVDPFADVIGFVKSDSKTSDGSNDIIEAVFPTKLNTSIHTHESSDESFIVLSGGLKFAVFNNGLSKNPEIVEIGKGGFLMVRKGTPFTWTSTSENTHIYIIFTPSSGNVPGSLSHLHSSKEWIFNSELGNVASNNQLIDQIGKETNTIFYHANLPGF